MIRESHSSFTCSILLPDLDRAVVRGRGHHGRRPRTPRQEDAAGRGLQVTSVLHHLTAWLPEVPQLHTDSVSDSVTAASRSLGFRLRQLGGRNGAEDEYGILGGRAWAGGKATGAAYCGFAAVTPESITAGQEVVRAGAHVAVRLNILLSGEGVGHLPAAAVPNPAGGGSSFCYISKSLNTTVPAANTKYYSLL